MVNTWAHKVAYAIPLTVKIGGRTLTQLIFLSGFPRPCSIDCPRGGALPAFSLSAALCNGILPKSLFQLSTQCCDLGLTRHEDEHATRG